VHDINASALEISGRGGTNPAFSGVVAENAADTKGESEEQRSDLHDMT